MFKGLVLVLISALLTTGIQADTAIGRQYSTSPQQGISASSAIRITVQIPIRASLKLQNNGQLIEQNNLSLKQTSSRLLTCYNSQGQLLANCLNSEHVSFYSLTIL